MTVWVALPVYNEAPRVPRLLARWDRVLRELGQPYAFVLVDDGSQDGSAEALSAFAADRDDVTVITHAQNQGLGATLRDGIEHVASVGAPDVVLVMMDGDDTHPPESFPGMLSVLEAGHDLVIASRFRAGATIEGLSLQRRVLSQSARVLFQLLHRIPGVRDYTCGYRAYRLALIQRALAEHGPRLIEREGFDCTADLLLKLARLGARCAEVPLHLDYRAKAGASHMQVRRTIRRTLGLFLRDVLRRD